MAITVTVASPYAFDTDLVSLTEAAALFADCGPGRDPSARTLKRWALKHGITVEKAGRDDVASWSDLLDVHAKEVDRREGRTRE